MEIKTKCCSRCQKVDSEDKFIKNRNICRECTRKRSIENTKKLKDIFLEEEYRICSNCNENKLSTLFVRIHMCNDCNNKKRKERYYTDEEYRLKITKRIAISGRIYKSLKFRKNKHTIDYLGCNYEEYLLWIETYEYTLQNHGTVWHIDHVIPISTFNLDNEEEQLLAFNWRNTMPLSVKENLSKNNRIDKTQVEHHYKKLVEYHIKNNIEMPQKFIELFAKHLVARNP